MCILIACPPGKSPEINDLWDATEQNPDGHGWAIRAHGTIERWVGMDPQRGLGTFLDARKRWPDGWCLWHSRFATQGNLDTSNCQPFEVPGSGWVMGHNGILPLSDGPWDHRRSDSRILAEDHLSNTTWAALRHNHGDLDRWLNPSKVVVMSPHKEKGGPVIIFGESRGTWAKDGCWWSTRPYWPVTVKGTGWAATKYLDDDDDAKVCAKCYTAPCDCYLDDEWDLYQESIKKLEESDR